MKKVKIEIEVEVDDDANFVAVDNDLNVYSFIDRPYKNVYSFTDRPYKNIRDINGNKANVWDTGNVWSIGSDVNRLYNCTNWQETLTDLSKPQPDLGGFVEHICEIRLDGGIDGFDLQDQLEKYGIIAPVVVNEPCGEDCVCATYTDEFPVKCYRKTY